MRRTVHWVTPEIDAGPIIGQAIVPVLDDNTEASFSARILTAEHRLYPWPGVFHVDDFPISVAR